MLDILQNFKLVTGTESLLFNSWITLIQLIQLDIWFLMVIEGAKKALYQLHRRNTSKRLHESKAIHISNVLTTCMYFLHCLKLQEVLFSPKFTKNEVWKLKLTVWKMRCERTPIQGKAIKSYEKNYSRLQCTNISRQQRLKTSLTNALHATTLSCIKLSKSAMSVPQQSTYCALLSLPCLIVQYITTYYNTALISLWVDRDNY